MTTPVRMDPVGFRAHANTIKPMLASPPREGTKITELKGWVFDTKIDGIRALAVWDGQVLRLVNRNGRDITHRYPELDFTSDHLGTEPVILDGEIVAQSGSFQDTQKRDKQTKPADVMAAMKQIPVAFLAFDILFLGTDLRHMQYVQRRQMLDAFPLPTDSIWQRTVVSMDPAFFDQVKALGMEGVIAKAPRSKYRAGRFSEWQKFKAVQSLTCVAYGYEPGEGRRAHFGAMFLALMGPTGPVQVGKVGTGFDDKEIDHLKAMLDGGQVVIVEIECLNKSKAGILRHPVYKGVRTDQSVADARLDQLDTIPEM